MRKIAVISSGRADYGHLIWPLRALQDSASLKPELIVLGAHPSPEFGHTDQVIAADGFEADEILETLVSSDSDVGMAKSLGLATLSLADCLGRRRPDLLLLIADRYEMLAPASVATTLRIPIAHIEGGEVSQGAIDDPIRNALTKLSHLHFAPTETAARRLIAIGEEPWRVHQVGAPSLDHLRLSELPGRAELENRLQFSLDQPVIVVACHPVTLQRNPVADALGVIEALKAVEGTIVFCFPNADAGARAIMRAAAAFCDGRDTARLFINLPHLDYWGLLQCADLLVGNSSSGIMEAPALKLPCVNVGDRQLGRQRSDNILDCSADPGAIMQACSQALEPTFREGLKNMRCAYGDGHAAERMVQVLEKLEFNERLIRKAPVPIEGQE